MLKKKIIKFKKLLLVVMYVTGDQSIKTSKILNIKYSNSGEKKIIIFSSRMKKY